MYNPYQMGFDFQPHDSIHYPTPQDESLANQRHLREVRDYYPIHTPQSAAYYFREHVFNPFEAFEQEEFFVMMLNTKMVVTYDAMVYRGTIDQINIRVGEVFKPAICCNASSIIVAHCHPSGQAQPSPEDVRVTELLIQAGELLGIHCNDHIVIGKNEWVSMKDRGLGFK